MIKKFESFTSDHLEDDPYSEEWWTDDDVEIKIGSIVNCITTCRTEGIEIESGENYEVINISDDEYFVELKGKANLIKIDFFKYYGKSALLDEFESDDEIIKYNGIIPLWWPKHIFTKNGK